MNRFFRWKVTKETGIAFAAGLAMIALSLLMLPFGGTSMRDTIVSFVLRDVCMIFGLGVVFVTVLHDKICPDLWSEMGLSKKKWKLSLILDVIFAAGLLAVFLKEQIPENILSVSNLYAAVYILTAGIFEMLFIYGFLRMSFEKAFGIVPAILLTSAFYSFHHAGFQPEFLHLFLVGLMYCSVFYITKNLLIMFPFFWAVGALWDVIVSSEAGEGIKNAESFIMALAILLLSAGWIFFRKRRKQHAVQNIHSHHGDAVQG
ncbi:MAG: CPBP family intramembrane metalloprotease [Clostridiales bacterium]|nr:CPBP family intramembrane metalloprotease [Clostridiales bacterium]